MKDTAIINDLLHKAEQAGVDTSKEREALKDNEERREIASNSYKAEYKLACVTKGFKTSVSGKINKRVDGGSKGTGWTMYFDGSWDWMRFFNIFGERIRELRIGEQIEIDWALDKGDTPLKYTAKRLK